MRWRGRSSRRSKSASAPFLEHPIVLKFAPLPNLTPRETPARWDPKDELRRVALCKWTDTRPIMCQEWPIRTEQAISGTDFDESQHSATRLSGSAEHQGTQAFKQRMGCSLCVPKRPSCYFTPRPPATPSPRLYMSTNSDPASHSKADDDGADDIGNHACAQGDDDGDHNDDNDDDHHDPTITTASMTAATVFSCHPISSAKSTSHDVSTGRLRISAPRRAALRQAPPPRQGTTPAPLWLRSLWPRASGRPTRSTAVFMAVAEWGKKTSEGLRLLVFALRR